MTAAHHAPGAQPTLAGLELPSPTTEPDVLCRVGIHGELAEAAHSWTNDHGEVLLQVVVRQRIAGHPKACCVVATERISTGSLVRDIDTGRARAARLPKGMPALVVGFGLQPGLHHSEPVLKLLHCTAITPLNLDQSEATHHAH